MAEVGHHHGGGTWEHPLSQAVRHYWNNRHHYHAAGNHVANGVRYVHGAIVKWVDENAKRAFEERIKAHHRPQHTSLASTHMRGSVAHYAHSGVTRGNHHLRHHAHHHGRHGHHARHHHGHHDVTRSEIVKALVPPFQTRQVIQQMCETGIAREVNMSGTTTTGLSGLYGLTSYVMSDSTFMAAVRTDAIAAQGTLSLVPKSTYQATTQGLPPTDKTWVKTHNHVHMTNTCGTSIVVDYFVFVATKLRAVAGQYPTWQGTPPADYLQCLPGGGPVCTSATLYALLTGGQDLANGAIYKPFTPLTMDNRFDFAPRFSRYFKRIVKKTFTLEHGQSVEFEWHAPTYSFSLVDLYEQGAYFTGGANRQVPHKTCWDVVRVRGAAAVVSGGGFPATVTTAVASVATVTTRTFSVRNYPADTAPVTALAYTLDMPQVSTGTATINEYGTAATIDPIPVIG